MSSMDSLLDTAFSAYNKGRFDEAESLAREVLSVTPSHGDALYLLGLIAFQSGALDPAADLLYQAVKLYPNMANYTLALAAALQAKGRLDEALSFYEKHKDNAQALAQIGFIYLAKNQHTWAENAFKKALELKADLTDSFIGLSLLAQHKNDFNHAKELLKQAENINPTSDVLYQMACLLYRQNDLMVAKEYIEKALSENTTPILLNQYGLILEALGMSDDALTAYIKASNLNPYFADAYFNQGNIYQKKGKLLAAEDSYKRAINQDKKFFDACHNLASLLYKQGRVAESLDYFQQAVILNPRSIQTVYNLAVFLEERGEFCESLGLYFNALALGMTDRILDFRIANALSGLAMQNKASKKQALQFAKGWVKNVPDNKIAIHSLAALEGKKDSDITEYARIFYDEFAASYDEKMIELKSVAINETIHILPKIKYKSILDLACGTGAFAKELNKNFKTLSGVDISSKMLEQAQKTGLYTHLTQDTATHFLQTTTQLFDLIVAIELIGYLDEILPLFNGASNHLMPNGFFVFTVEKTPDDKDYILMPNGRYLYSKSFILAQLKKANLHIDQTKEINLRREGDDYAKGIIFLVGKA